MAGPSDDQLLRMLQEVEGREDVVDATLYAPNEESVADACEWCGVPSENVGACHYCGEAGCLPGELWTPGEPDPCLTLCVRCARSIHLSCGMDDQAGNPRCPTCHY